MSKNVIALEQITVEVGGKEYLVQAFPAKYGLAVMEEMLSDTGFSTDRMVDVLIRSVTYRGTMFTEKSFGVHFSRKYKDVVELFNEVLAFNFGEEMESPLGEESSESAGTSEE